MCMEVTESLYVPMCKPLYDIIFPFHSLIDNTANLGVIHVPSNEIEMIWLVGPFRSDSCTFKWNRNDNFGDWFVPLKSEIMIENIYMSGEQ